MNPTLDRAAAHAYEAFAPAYDLFTHDYAYGPWMTNVEAVARRLGLRGRRLLDVACGTGKSFMPMLALGYEVTACDISPAMAERARAAAAGTATHVVVADLRDLPVLGRFDLVTSMCDSLNYLTSDRELAMAFGSVARNVRAGGLFAFDLNTIGRYRQEFPGRSAREVGGTFFLWMRDPGEPASRAGAHFSSTLEVFAPREGGRWWRSTSRHVQRHHPPELVKRLLCEAGFELAQCYGQQPGGRLEPFADEAVHMKVDYFARRLPADAR